MNSSAVAILRCSLVNGGLEFFVDTLLRTKSCYQRREPNCLLVRNLSVVLMPGQHIKLPLRYVERVDLDPGRLDEIDRRITALHAAARKFRLAPEALPDELATMQARLVDLAAAQDTDALRAQEAAARARYDQAARRLSEARRAAARALQQQVTEHMQGLGMGGGREGPGRE